MALSSLLMQELCKRLKPGAVIASMGYPDIIAPHKALQAILGAKFYFLKYREDSEQIQKWHGATQKVPDADSFFGLQGCMLDVFDIARHRGVERLCDLNEPFTVPHGYDFVIDVGTMEHCFNIGIAACSMAGMLKQGGIILHENPFNWGNHGFWNINPTFYADFYGQQGFRLHECWLVPRDGEPIKDIERNKRFAYNGPEANMIAIAERVETLPIAFPVQGKYKSMIQAAFVAPAAGVPGEQLKEVANG